MAFYLNVPTRTISVTVQRPNVFWAIFTEETFVKSQVLGNKIIIDVSSQPVHKMTYLLLEEFETLDKCTAKYPAEVCSTESVVIEKGNQISIRGMTIRLGDNNQAFYVNGVKFPITLKMSCPPQLKANMPQTVTQVMSGPLQSCIALTNFIMCTDGEQFFLTVDTKSQYKNCPENRSSGKPNGFELQIELEGTPITHDFLNDNIFVQTESPTVVAMVYSQLALLFDGNFYRISSDRFSLVPDGYGNEPFLA